MPCQFTPSPVSQLQQCWPLPIVTCSPTLYYSAFIIFFSLYACMCVCVFIFNGNFTKRQRKQSWGLPHLDLWKFFKQLVNNNIIFVFILHVCLYSFGLAPFKGSPEPKNFYPVISRDYNGLQEYFGELLLLLTAILSSSLEPSIFTFSTWTQHNICIDVFFFFFILIFV